MPLLEECNKQRGCKYDCLVGLVKAAADQGHLTDLFGWLFNLRRTLCVQAESNTSCLQAEVVFLKDRAMWAQVDTLAWQVRQRAFSFLLQCQKNAQGTENLAMWLPALT